MAEVAYALLLEGKVVEALMQVWETAFGGNILWFYSIIFMMVGITSWIKTQDIAVPFMWSIVAIVSFARYSLLDPALNTLLLILQIFAVIGFVYIYFVKTK